MKCSRCGTESTTEICPKCTETKGYKKDAGKPRPALMATGALIELSKVLQYGANKYDDDNWRHGMRWRRVADAGLRHLLAWLGGEKMDPETGLPHLAHCMCNIMFLLEYELTNTGIDDRWKGTKNEPEGASQHISVPGSCPVLGCKVCAVPKVTRPE